MRSFDQLLYIYFFVDDVYISVFKLCFVFLGFRFVRFVNTPDVLESLKSLEDEVLQLEQVTMCVRVCVCLCTVEFIASQLNEIIHCISYQNISTNRFIYGLSDSKMASGW